MNDLILKVFNRLPYKEPFLFVDIITKITDQEISGEYTFNTNCDFYKGHFAGNPVTPGVLLVESLAQLGGVAHGIYLLGLHHTGQPFIPAFSNASFDFYKPVFPGKTIKMYSEKIALRSNYIKIKGSIYCENDLVMQLSGSCKFILL